LRLFSIWLHSLEIRASCGGLMLIYGGFMRIFIRVNPFQSVYIRVLASGASAVVLY